MANVLKRDLSIYLTSVHTPDYPLVDWVHNPDLSAVVGFDLKYWTLTGDVVGLMDQSQRDAVDAQEEADRIAVIKQELKDRFNQEDDNTKAVGLLMLQMYDLIKAEIKANALSNPLPDITQAQLKTRFDNIVDGL